MLCVLCVMKNTGIETANFKISVEFINSTQVILN